ncbi:LPS export ABC transporter permease LptG [Uliginosibacterium aquaticum]|uniref:LPS export ABC transporter permease LptG n=1 Tax=Uliginosibacterium aquaticum TaxID=2731212 RepID=A0ABX2IR43_9RHOO|nr:LPS export ABC transporter permease LptG [Uliginosibacterium aquaticum]NSL56470.1 LPS export ABC transporter permease LptG [Uliginosibacterium aquaticum]
MKTARGYLRREIIYSTLLVLGAFLCLFAFFDFLAELEDLGKEGYRLKHAVIFVALSIPSRAYEVMPIAVLIGTLYALTQFARNSELTVLRAAGVSTRQLLIALMRIGLFFVVLTFVLGEYVAPPLERIGQKWRLRTTNATVPQELRTGMWMRDGRLFVNVQRVLPDASLETVKIYEFDSEHRLATLNVAKRGVYSVEQGWLLSEVVQTRFHGDRTELLNIPSLRWASELTPELISVVMVTPERMALASLYQYKRHLEANSQRTGRYAVAFWKKLVYPLVTLVMMVLALPFCLGNQRSVNVGARVLTGVMLGIGFYLLNALFSNLGVLNAWPALMSAALPSLLFFLLAVGLMWKVDRR